MKHPYPNFQPISLHSRKRDGYRDIFRYPTAFNLRTFLFTSLMLITMASHGQYKMENINRGVVAVRTSSNEVYVGWRMFGTDPSNVSFNVYRGSTKLNANPITNSTNYVDNTSSNSTYHIRPVINGVEQAASETVSIWGQNYLNVPLQRPSGGTTPDGSSYNYSANDCSVADLDGDGEYEIIVKWDPSNAHDNAHQGYTGNVYLDAYKLDGTRLWRIDLGRNIRAGAHYTQFMVYDLDSDGKAELACKTAPNTRDGSGNYLSLGPAANDNDNADYRTGGSWAGFITDGPEYLTVFNGETGAEMATTNYVPDRYPTDGWGKAGDNTNRVDRFLAGIGYFDGQNPSLLMCRGYYGRSVLVAWDWRNGQLTQRWEFDTNDAGNGSYAGKGNHQLSIADVDADGKDEVIYGAMVVNDNGTGLYTSTWGHGDAMHVSDLIPGRPGLEVFTPIEWASADPGQGRPAVVMRDALTGEIIWAKYRDGDIGRGLCADITPEHAGVECWASSGLGVYNSQGTQISTSIPSINFAIWWDGDLSRELLNGTTISKYNSGNLLSPSGVASNNGTKATPALTADLFGDWREEVIWRTSDDQNLRIYTTTATTDHRLYTLMHNPQYRVAVAWQNVAYNQPPWPSYFLGNGMSTPPQPNIVLVGEDNPPVGEDITIQEDATGFCSVDGTIDSNHSGYTGSGFSNADNATGAGIDWKVDFTSAGSHTFTFRYANGTTSSRPCNLIVNGSTVASNISFPGTGGWASWNEVSVIVNISVTGARDVRLEATGSAGPANIDNIRISGPSTPAVASCSASNDIISEGTYYITARHSGKALDVNEAGTTNGSNVIQWAYGGGSNQHWVVTDLNNGYYRLSPTHATGQSLDVASVSTADGANVHIWAYGGGNNQQWQITDQGNGYYQIVARHSGKCLDVDGGSTADGANVQQWACGSSQNQQWSFTSVGSSRMGDTVEERSAGENVDNELAIYPNPSQQGDFMIDLPNDFADAKVTIFDNQGRMVYEKTLTGAGKMKVNSRLKSGVYMMKINSLAPSYTKKLVVL